MISGIKIFQKTTANVGKIKKTRWQNVDHH